MTTRICGAGLAFLGFSLSLLIGLWVGNPFTTVVSRSLLVLLLFYLLGCILAAFGQVVIEENVEAEKQAHAAQAEQAPPEEPAASQQNESNGSDAPAPQPAPTT